MKKILFAVSALLFAPHIDAEVHLIPQPVSIQTLAGDFSIHETTKVVNQAKLSESQFSVYCEMLRQVSGSPLEVGQSTHGSISLELGDVKGGREAYAIKVSKERVRLVANTSAGLLYGVQTLSQLIESDRIPGVLIQDYPRYAWRGLHLDVSRHFFEVDFIKRYIDLMVMYKYNVFHWHLSDDDGWRLESKKFPLLTEKGAFRPRVGRGGNQAKGLNVDDGKAYGGFYTQDQIREIIAYAKERNVNVLPEIDVPGHSRAIVQSYPQYGTHPGSDVLNVGNPETIQFLEELFAEVAELFPFGYVHIGCDEVGLGAWKNNADCRAKMKELGTDDPHVLHKWLVEHLQQFLAKKNKQAVAWCEVLDAKVDKETVVMAWRDNGGWIKAPKLGHKVVVTPSMQTYFNYQEDVASNAPGHGGYRTTMQKVYHFDPTDASLSEAEKKLILGGQGCVWTEYIPLPEHVEYITFPRAAALAEALWSPKETKNWGEFQKRVDRHTRYMDIQSIGYRIGAPVPLNKRVSFVGAGVVVLTNPNLRGEIRYTVDGSEPEADSPLYPKNGIKVVKSAEVKAAVFYPNGRSSYRTLVEVKQSASADGIELSDAQRGLHYKVFDKKGNDFREFFSGAVRSEGRIDRLEIPASERGKDHFVVAYSGYLKIGASGALNFRLSADDAATLFIHGRKLADHRHEGTAFLGKGFHPFTLLYRENAGAERFRVEIQKDGQRFEALPDAMLYTSEARQLTPLAVVDSNMQAASGSSTDDLLDGSEKTVFRTRAGLSAEHYLNLVFSEAQPIQEIEVVTGDDTGRQQLAGAILEVSEDGKTFAKLADFTGGVAKGNPERAVKVIRLKVIRPQTEQLLLQGIRIKK